MRGLCSGHRISKLRSGGRTRKRILKSERTHFGRNVRIPPKKLAEISFFFSVNETLAQKRQVIDGGDDRDDQKRQMVDGGEDSVQEFPIKYVQLRDVSKIQDRTLA